MHFLKSCTKAITCALQIITYAVRKKGMEHKEVNFGGTMMQALELLQLPKRHVSRLSDVKQ